MIRHLKLFALSYVAALKGQSRPYLLIKLPILVLDLMVLITPFLSAYTWTQVALIWLADFLINLLLAYTLYNWEIATRNQLQVLKQLGHLPGWCEVWE